MIARLDRITRNLLDFVRIARLMNEHGVALVVLGAATAGAVALDALRLNILATFAEFEREMIRERIRDARAALKTRGRRIAGAIPFGYSTDRTKQLVPEPVEAGRVAQMFRWAAAGMTPGAIAAKANEFGWETKAPRSWPGGRWTPRQVLVTLANPVYVGKVRDGDELRDGVHASIVNEHLFAAAHEQIEARRTREPGRAPATEWFLQHKVVCGECGRAMSTHTRRRTASVARYYRCRSNSGGRRPCPAQMANADLLENFVLERLKSPGTGAGFEAPIATALEKMSHAWDLMVPWFRRIVVTDLVKQVRFDARTDRVEIEFDADAAVTYTSGSREELKTSVVPHT